MVTYIRASVGPTRPSQNGGKLKVTDRKLDARPSVVVLCLWEGGI